MSVTEEKFSEKFEAAAKGPKNRGAYYQEEATEKGMALVEAKFKVLFAITRGPAMPGPQGHFTYFVALPAFYPSPAAKQTLAVDFVFPEGNVTTMMVRDEEVVVALPVPTRRAAGDQAVYVGFQLSPEQLEFNRSNRR